MPADNVSHAAPTAAPKARHRAKQVLSPIASLVAILYFLIDAIFLSIIRPIAITIGKLPIFNSVREWLTSLGRYPTLALFLVPVAVLEPAKPLGAYLMAKGHIFYGVGIIAVAEILKITIVERLFHFSRDKLMTIPAFAWGYNWVMVWLAYVQAQPLWQAASAQLAKLKIVVRDWKNYAARLLRRSTSG